MPNLDFKYITDENGNRVLPITHINAVRDSNGNTLPTLMAPEKNGTGIGTCSTSSGTALAVSLNGYELVQNGFVAVTFENDVPANATLNINSKGAKPIIYKGSAITADTIKADDTVMFCYDGTNYVVTSLGGDGSAPVNPNETVNISLTQVGGNSADLTGASITITDDDSGDTLYTATWAGTMLTTEIDVNTNYTVSVGTIAGYLACADQSYQAGYQTERNISFQYIALGAFVEATDGTLYTAAQWTSSGKTANSVVVITSTYKFRIAITNGSYSNSYTAYGGNNGYDDQVDPQAYGVTQYPTEAAARQNYTGVKNTSDLWSFFTARGYTSNDGVLKIAHNYTFPDGTQGYLPSIGELSVYVNNKAAINQCAQACGAFSSDTEYSYASSTAKDSNPGSAWPQVWGMKSDGTIASGLYYGAYAYRIFGIYE